MKPGHRVGPYTLSSFIGGGGNGDVWTASDESGTTIALKVLKEGRVPPDAIPRFKREIAALKQLGHSPGIVPLLLHGEESPGRPWYSMPIAEPIRNRVGSQLERIIEAIAALADSLANIHGRDMAHRDIKPENLYWWNGAYCLGDFGLVRLPKLADHLLHVI